MDQTTFVSVSQRDTGLPLWRLSSKGQDPTEMRIFALRGGAEEPLSIAFHEIVGTNGIDAFIAAATEKQSSVPWIPIAKRPPFAAYEIPMETNYKKWIFTYVVTPKTQVAFGLVPPLILLYLVVIWYHRSKYGNADVNMMRNLYQHWCNAAPALAQRTAKAREAKLNAERRAREHETLKEKRERIRREEEDGEEDYVAPEAVVKAFALFDHDQDGVISTEDLAHVAKQIGHEVDYQLFEELILSVDLDLTGEVNVLGFHTMSEAKQYRQRVQENVEED